MSNNRRREQSDMQSPNAFVSGIFFMLACLAGLLSSLKIVSDFSGMMLADWLRELVDSYSQIVDRVTDFLFGWIDLWWMNVTTIEGHVIVLGFVVLCILVHIMVTGMHGGSNITVIDRMGGWAIDLFLLLFVLVVIVPIVLLPGWLGMTMTALNLAAFAVAAFRGRRC